MDAVAQNSPPGVSASDTKRWSLMSNMSFSRYCHCGTSFAGARISRRRTRPEAISGISTKPHSMVLPSPTSSATSHRNGHSRFTCRQTHN